MGVLLALMLHRQSSDGYIDREEPQSLVPFIDSYIFNFFLYLWDEPKSEKLPALKVLLNQRPERILNGLAAGRLSSGKFLGDPVSLCNLSWEWKWLAGRLQSCDSLRQSSVSGGGVQDMPFPEIS